MFFYSLTLFILNFVIKHEIIYTYMILQRDDHRRQRQMAYRQELLNEIQSKPTKNRRSDGNANEDFSLIKNIQVEQQNRKNKQKQYYAQLRSHMQEEEARKKKSKQEKMRRELEEDQKIRRQNEMLNKRYQQEMRREQTKGKPNKPTHNVQVEEPPMVRYIEDQVQFDNKRQSFIQKKIETAPDIIDNINAQQNYHNRYQPVYQQDKQFIPRHYSGKIQNEGFNFVSQPKINRKYYYKEILQTKKTLQHQTGLLSELNQVLSRQKYRDRGKKYGLQQLQLLNELLQNKQSNYQKERFTKLRGSSQKSQLKKIIAQEDTHMDKWYRL